jgi:hypothetical protein
VSWTSPDPWHCYECGADGLGGRTGADAHVTAVHAPKPAPVPVARGVVPDGVDPSAARAWVKTNGWPNIGQRGRLPQATIDAYLNQPRTQPARGIDLTVVDELYALGNSRIQVAHRLGVTLTALEKAESRRRRP